MKITKGEKIGYGDAARRRAHVDRFRDLEKAVEALSELLERPIETETIASLRQQVTDKTVYVLKRNEVMLEDTAKGFQEGRWTWNTDVGPFSR